MWKHKQICLCLVCVGFAFGTVERMLLEMKGLNGGCWEETRFLFGSCSVCVMFVFGRPCFYHTYIKNNACSLIRQDNVYMKGLPRSMLKSVEAFNGVQII